MEKIKTYYLAHKTTILVIGGVLVAYFIYTKAKK
jgi:hypothetical protein